MDYYIEEKEKKKKKKNLRYVTRVKILFFFFEEGSDTLRLTGIAKRVPLRVIETTPERLVGNQRKQERERRNGSMNRSAIASRKEGEP